MQFGVDEAGKGPVFGSMFVAAVRAPESAIPNSVDDSKQLSDSRRESLAERLRADDRVNIAVVEVTPDRIDAGDMHDITVASHAEAISAVAKDGDRGCCDAADVNADRFGTRIEDRVDRNVTVDAAHGADAMDPLVSAASVVAKSEREQHVETLRTRFGSIGSGYPSDPKTRTFLREYVAEHGVFPPLTRISWATCDSIRAELAQTDLDEF